MIIGIVHHESTEKFLIPLLRSLSKSPYQIQVVYNNKGYERDFNWAPYVHFPLLYNPQGGFELGALQCLMEMNPEENDFFLLHSSTLVKDLTIFDIAAQFKGSLAICPGFGSFMGKYRREILEKVGIPVPQDRQVAIYYEKYWNEIYMNTETTIASCDEPLVDSKIFEMKYGRKNMVLENVYLKKWKSNWKGFKINMF